jgi:hypothetical protein
MNSCGESVPAAEAVLGCELACILDPMEILAAIRATVATEKMILRMLVSPFWRSLAFADERSKMSQEASMVG